MSTTAPTLAEGAAARFKARKNARSISHAEKRRICELDQQNPRLTHNELADLLQEETGHKVERSTVSRVLQRREFWLGPAAKDGGRKRLAKPRFPTVDEALYELIRHHSLACRGERGLADKDLIRYSKEIANTLKVEHGCLDKNSPNFVPLLDSFRGSLSWLCMFRRRNALMGPEEVRPRIGKIIGMTRSVETPEIWPTHLDVPETKSLLNNWTRFEDVYFLEASILATTALPEHATEKSSTSQPEESPYENSHLESLGIMDSIQHDDSSEPADLGGAAFPTINFALPALAPTLDVSTAPGINNADHHNHQPAFGAPPDPFAPSANISGTAPNEGVTPRKNRCHIDQNSVVVALLCANGNGGDRQIPWLVGKQHLRTIGLKDGEVWPDCKVRYFHNVRGWLTSRIVRKWVEEFDQTLKRSVALVTSLLSASDMQLMELKFVTIIPLARTERLNESIFGQQWKRNSSPMNQGVEEVFRAKYRCLVLENALECISRGAKIKPVTLKEAAPMIEEAWDKVPVALVRRAWRDVVYIPLRLARTTGNPRGNSRALADQRVQELGRLIRCYRSAIAAHTGNGRYHLGPTDTQVAIADPRTYIWLTSEPSVFHPKGKVVDFAHCVCSAERGKEPKSDEEMVEEQKNASEDIISYEDALQTANKLANFVRSKDILRTGQGLYFIGALQLELKKLCDQKQDIDRTNAWSG